MCPQASSNVRYLHQEGLAPGTPGLAMLIVRLEDPPSSHQSPISIIPASFLAKQIPCLRIAPLALCYRRFCQVLVVVLADIRCYQARYNMLQHWLGLLLNPEPTV
jgi:hypothetical protein